MTGLKAACWKAGQGTSSIEVGEVVSSCFGWARAKEGLWWHSTDEDIGSSRSGLGDEGLGVFIFFCIMKQSSQCSVSQGERDRVGSRRGVGLGRGGGEVSCRRSVSPVDRMRIREVLIDSHGLVRTGGNDRKFDIG